MTPGFDVIEAGAGALADYYDWFDTAPTGRRLQYYVGDLRYDRNPDHFPHITAERRRDIDALNSLATRILADAREGSLDIFQRHLGFGQAEYLAVMKRAGPLTRRTRTLKVHERLAN